MFNLEYVNAVFKDFIKQTSSETGLCINQGITKVNYGIKVNFSIGGKRRILNEAYPVLNIAKYSDFIATLTKLVNKMATRHMDTKNYYMLNKQSYAQFIVMSIVANMHASDFNSPISYLNRLIDSLDYDYQFNKELKIGETDIKNEHVDIFKLVEKNMLGMESMQNIKFSFVDKNNNMVYLPAIHYYLSDNKAYILGIQRVKNHVSDIELNKKVDRYLRKLDKGIEIEEEYIEGVNNIKDISVSALAALTLFVSYYKDLDTIYMPDYLPLRYINKIKDGDQEKIEKTDAIQTNITDKLLMTGVRLCEHFDHLDCGFDCGILEINMNDYKLQEGNIIYDLYESVNKHYKKDKVSIKKTNKVN